MKRVCFLDYLRVVAIFMVMLVHACEQYYFGADGGFFIASKWDARWVVIIDSACRAAVPLFVMASAYLLFPITKPTGEFLRHRILRVGIPFAVWAAVCNWRFGGDWQSCLFNFPMTTGGHLWFVPMLIGLYLLMPLLSPWAEKVSEREIRGWLIVWLFTTLFPFLRKFSMHLYGECPWNGFGTFQYVSGFFGYMLLGFYFRKFVPEWTWRHVLIVALPLLIVGWSIVAGGFYFRIVDYGASFPVSAPYEAAVDLETSWEFCSLGVAMMVAGYFLLLRRLSADGGFYHFIIRPLSAASFGVYLIHMLVLVEATKRFKPMLATPTAIVVIAFVTFVISALMTIGWQKTIGRKCKW